MTPTLKILITILFAVLIVGLWLYPEAFEERAWEMFFGLAIVGVLGWLIKRAQSK